MGKKVQEGQSKNALKRVEKEKELYLSSWKLANIMYSQLWGERWPALKEAILEKKKMYLCETNLTKDSSIIADVELEIFDEWLRYAETEINTDKHFKYEGCFPADFEALFLLKIMAPAKHDNILGE
jgi:hypothetical protein